MPTTTPAIPQIKADFAILSFEASPIAVKNMIPATTKQTTTTSVNIIHSAVVILNTIFPKIIGDPYLPKPYAETIPVGKNKIADRIKNNVLFFTSILYF